MLGRFETSLRGGDSPSPDRKHLHRGCCGSLHGHGVPKERPAGAARDGFLRKIIPCACASRFFKETNSKAIIRPQKGKWDTSKSILSPKCSNGALFWCPCYYFFP